MKNKQINFILTLYVLAFVLFPTGILFTDTGTAKSKEVRSGVEHTDYYDVLLSLLDPYARKVITKEYPERSYALWDAEIIEVKRLTRGFPHYNFIVKVKYDTYTGALNPPEGYITITFHVTLEGVSVIKIQK